MRGRWELADKQWELIEPVLRPSRRADNRGRPWHDTRSVLNGVLWVLGTEAQWRELPEKYPPFQTCHRRFQQWVRTGKLEEALRRLARYLHERGELNLEPARLVGDKAYDSDKLDQRLAEAYDIEMIAPNRSNRSKTQDGRKLHCYRRRWKVERLFAWMHNFRRLVTRWEYHIENFLGFVHLACLQMMLTHL
jgi:transposase